MNDCFLYKEKYWIRHKYSKKNKKTTKDNLPKYRLLNNSSNVLLNPLVYRNYQSLSKNKWISIKYWNEINNVLTK